jgi:predicted nucleotidyltransferase component of viral defense system
LNDKPTLEELLEIQEHFGLPSPALVEKDWYVVKALAAIAAAETAPFRLVFGGGTALSRAYGLLRRMSEDIDLKIVSEKKPSRHALGNVHGIVTDALLGAGFVFDPAKPEHRVSMHKSTFTRYQLPYAAITEGKSVLRAEIQIEISARPLRRPSIDRSVRSFVAEALDRPAEIAAIACAAIPESAGEKLVALTRRAGAELAGLRKERDPTLVRHLHDLHVIRGEYDAAEVAALACDIMLDDARAHGKDFPAYGTDPLAETLKAIDGIAGDKGFAESYATFSRDMVYGDKPDFETAIDTLKALAGQLRKAKA